MSAPAALLLLCCLGPAACGGRATASRVSKAAPPTTPAAPAVASASQPATTPPSTAPVATVAYEDKEAGFRLAYPTNWRPRQTKEYTFMLVPAGSDRTSKSDNDGALGEPKITVDLPWIPPHLPGMITLGRVEGGYMDDQKARFTDVTVTEKSNPAVPGAKARRLVLTGHAKTPGGAGPTYTVVTLLEIHAERVYVVSAEARSDEFPAVLADFDRVTASMQWTK